MTDVVLSRLTVEPLTPATWPAFAALVERHNGIFGGCWCTYFHCVDKNPDRARLGNERFKEKLVAEGKAHAALVMDGDEAVAWAEYGPVDELPNIQHRKQWEAETEEVPDYRITCVFVDKRYRRHGLSTIAIKGALRLIAQTGGGLVEAYPHDLPPEKKMNNSFLYNGTRTLYERLGFTYLRPKGQGNCVVAKKVRAAPGKGRGSKAPRVRPAGDRVAP